MRLIENRFATYELSTEEELRGCIYTIEQKAVLQNELSLAAVAKSALKLDPNDVITYAQNEAAISGKIEHIEYMLSNSDAAEEQLLRHNTDTTDTEE